MDFLDIYTYAVGHDLYQTSYRIMSFFLRLILIFYLKSFRLTKQGQFSFPLKPNTKNTFKQLFCGNKGLYIL